VQGHVHGASTAVYRVHLHGRVLCTRPCLWPVYTAAHGRVQTAYTAVHGPRTWSVRDPITAVYAARTRPCTVNTAVFTARVHGIVRTVYTAVQGVYGSRTPGARAVYMVRPRPCTGYTYTVVYAVYPGVFTARVHGPSMVVYTGGKHARVHDRCVRTGRHTALCTGHGRTMCTTLARRCSRFVHGRGHVLCTCTGHERGRLCKRSEAKAEAEAKARPTPRPRLRL